MNEDMVVSLNMNANMSWAILMSDIIRGGNVVSPRGQRTKELLQKTIAVDMRYPVVTIKDRKLSYQFMAAEALWILSGDNRVDTIEPWNKNISQFSDDGRVFFGAYGPKILNQYHYVIDKLVKDRDTRQAGLTIWRENPPDTKDVPCTISIFFNIRKGKLNCHVFMRSSDAWLGIPYDVFNFSMLAHSVCSTYDKICGDRIEPGILYLTAASSHLYERNWDEAKFILSSNYDWSSNPTPDGMSKAGSNLLELLSIIRDSKPGDEVRWWEVR